MHRDRHRSPDQIDDHLPEREFSVMYVVFSNRRVTYLRDLDARDGFGNIQKHRVMIYERENSSN
jgi:ssDNA-specific exonuclease RecJ